MNLKQKLSSRKLWAAVAGVVTGISMIFRLDQSIVNTVSGAVLTFGSVLVYIITEGRIDAKAVASAAEKVQEAIDAVNGQEES